MTSSWISHVLTVSVKGRNWDLWFFLFDVNKCKIQCFQFHQNFKSMSSLPNNKVVLILNTFNSRVYKNNINIQIFHLLQRQKYWQNIRSNLFKPVSKENSAINWHHNSCIGPLQLTIYYNLYITQQLAQISLYHQYMMKIWTVSLILINENLSLGNKPNRISEYIQHDWQFNFYMW